ncbi:hypothetical protein BD626DRAFT_438798 [Schizophyllum amplum]|uniref:RanBD1 domain-containing protein n=1 Tax=Schizophyllum amplum TaxID=97359 RepID=A0A550BZC2_9AGAR|nr:hypothetical protein BD626DRAFT_438798 [Auriculariopsis ampla]
MSEPTAPPPTDGRPPSQKSSSPTPEPAEAPTSSATKTARKREREVSLEPALTCASSTAGSVDVKEQQAPKKKNKIALDSHPEEEGSGSRSRSASRSRSNSPKGLSSSPRQEQAVRQIRRGVEDLNWQNTEGQSPPRAAADHDMAETSSDNAGPVATAADARTKHDDADMHSVSARSNSPASQKAASVVMGSASGSSQPTSRRASDASMEEGGRPQRKRKLVDRGVSEGPSTPQETLKRSRDDPEDDENPREKKRPTPPPDPAPTTVDATSRRSIDSLKRSREDDDDDRDPREHKRPTPPPEDKEDKPPKKEKKEKKETTEKKDSKPSAAAKGFMAFAGAASPFAGVKVPVKGPAKFGTTTSASPSPPAPSVPSTPNNPPTPSTSKDPFARSGFAAFTGSASPFATVARTSTPIFGSASRIERPNTPERSTPTVNIKSNAFSAYTTSNPFGTSAKANGAGSKSDQADSGKSTPSPDGEDGAEKTSFQDKLRAHKDVGDSDDEEKKKKAKLNLKEQEVATGEEDEEIVFSGRGKLYLMDGDAYKERGVGIMKVNVKREDRKIGRLIMRKDTVHNLLLNASTTSIAKCEVNKADTRYLLLSIATGTGIETYTFRMREASLVQQLADAAKDPAAYLERKEGGYARLNPWLATPQRHRAVAVDDAAGIV